MRHQIKGYRLNRNMGHRTSMRRTMIKQLFEHERIKTTLAKAKAIQPDAEKLITLAKNVHDADDIKQVNARRAAAAQLGNNSGEIVKLFDDIAPRFTSRKGGYTRLLKLGPPRQGDNAEMVVLELVAE